MTIRAGRTVAAVRVLAVLGSRNANAAQSTSATSACVALPARGALALTNVRDEQASEAGARDHTRTHWTRWRFGGKER